MARSAGADPASTLNRRPHIGAFVLETLTLGMYGEPRHALREYIQNSFDAIRAATRLRFLTGRGRVDVTIGPDTIRIRDNGLGVRADMAWNTLTSVGASRKDRERDAGFRGIGRLGGMAYCDLLTFRTTFPGEEVVTTVRFDCTLLREEMDPDQGGDAELAKLLEDAITFEQTGDAAAAENHFFEVTLSGLEEAPESLKEPDKVIEYLSETVPVGFEPSWAHRNSIESDFQSYFGEPLETVDVFVSPEGGTPVAVYKPYGDAYQLGKGTAQLATVEFSTGKNNGYWGWVGRLNKSGAVTDWLTRGLRVRVRNIQIDGTELLESLFAQAKPSYGRFSTWYVGEIHINPEKVVPNARRDGFEETDEWIEIKETLVATLCTPLAKEAYDASRKGQVDVEKVVSDINQIIRRSQSLADNSRATYDQVVDLMNSAKSLRKRALSALKIVDDLDDTEIDEGAGPEALTQNKLQEAASSIQDVEQTARMLIGRFLGEDERLTALKQRLRQEILKELLDVVNSFVDPGTYQKIRRQLARDG
jgi:hypothetical protein